MKERTEEIIVQRQKWGYLLLGLLFIEALHGLHIALFKKHLLGFTHFAWLTPQMRFGLGGLGLLLGCIATGLRYYSYFIALKRNVLGIAENGHQLLIPLESITNIHHIVLGRHTHVLTVSYQYQRKVKKVVIRNTMLLMGKISFLKNFDLFWRELKVRKSRVLTVDSAEASERGVNRTNVYYRLIYGSAVVCLFLSFS